MSYFMAKNDVNYIRETSGKALSFMMAYDVVPSPANYQVWYNYACEEDMSLNKTIDDIIRKRKAFTTEICKNLYEKYFSKDLEQNAVTTVGQGTQVELTRIAKTVRDINKGTVKYGEALNQSLQDMDNIPGVSELKAIVSGLLEKSEQVVKNNISAQQQLKESSQTVQKLQTTLEAVHQESLTDMLTNIGNRKLFEESLKTAMQVANKENGELCVIIGDVDDFKKFNDKWGHHVGDQVLKAVAHSMKTRVGDIGKTARYGGEEFVILLPDISMKKAKDLSETIRVAIATRNMTRKSTGEPIGKISCSFGVAKYRQKEHRNEFLERADAALSRSKSNGRNRVTVEDEFQMSDVRIA